jgi:hypothetical protein
MTRSFLPVVGDFINSRIKVRQSGVCLVDFLRGGGYRVEHACRPITGATGPSREGAGNYGCFYMPSNLDLSMVLASRSQF